MEIYKKNLEYPSGSPAATPCLLEQIGENWMNLLYLTKMTSASWCMRQAFGMGFSPGEKMGGLDSDDVSNGRENTPSIFSSSGLSAGAFLKSPFRSHPEWANSTAPDVQVRRRLVARVEVPVLTLYPCRGDFEAWNH